MIVRCFWMSMEYSEQSRAEHNDGPENKTRGSNYWTGTTNLRYKKFGIWSTSYLSLCLSSQYRICCAVGNSGWVNCLFLFFKEKRWVLIDLCVLGDAYPAPRLVGTPFGFFGSFTSVLSLQLPFHSFSIPSKTSHFSFSVCAGILGPSFMQASANDFVPSFLPSASSLSSPPPTSFVEHILIPIYIFISPPNQHLSFLLAGHSRDTDVDVA